MNICASKIHVLKLNAMWYLYMGPLGRWLSDGVTLIGRNLVPWALALSTMWGHSKRYWWIWKAMSPVQIQILHARSWTFQPSNYEKQISVVYKPWQPPITAHQIPWTRETCWGWIMQLLKNLQSMTCTSTTTFSYNILKELRQAPNTK